MQFVEAGFGQGRDQRGVVAFLAEMREDEVACVRGKEFLESLHGTGPWKQLADDLALSDMTPKATYQPSDEINQAIKGATLAWATAKDEKEGTETPAGGDDRSASR